MPNTPANTQTADSAPQTSDTPRSGRRRKLISAAIKGAPYAVTLASGSSLANTSAFQCIQNTRDVMFTDQLSGEHALPGTAEDHYVRSLVDEYELKQVEETLQQDPEDPDQTIWVKTAEIPFTIYIPFDEDINPDKDIDDPQFWYAFEANRLDLFDEPLPEDTQPNDVEGAKRYRWDTPESTGGNVKAIVFFAPNADDTGLTGVIRAHPFLDAEDIINGGSPNAPGTQTPLTQTCLCSVDPENYQSICV